VDLLREGASNDSGVVEVRNFYRVLLARPILVLSSTCHFLTDNSLQFADKNQQESSAVAEKPNDAVVKFDTAAARGPPCDSTAPVTIGRY